jgi:multidrug resistance efflux pump
MYGVVVLEVSPPLSPQMEALLQQLYWGTAWLGVARHRQQSSQTIVTQKRLQVVLNVLATAVEHEGFPEAATAFVTDLATRLTCECVSLGCVRGRHVQLRAMSHSTPGSTQTNLTRAIEDAMDEALDQETVIVYPPASDTTFQITRLHEQLAKQHETGTICSVPLRHDGRTFGVLTFERHAAHPFDPSTVALCEAIAALAGPILEVKQREDRWLIAKAIEALRTQIGHLVGPRHVALKFTSLALVAVITLFAVVKADYRTVAKTVIEAQRQRVAVAPFAGYLAAAHVRAGDRVHAGDTLCTLDERELTLQRRKWLGQKEQYVKQYHQAMADGNAARVTITSAQVAQAQAELALVDDQLARTQVRAPFDGIIVTGDLSQSIGVPVERGQVLFEVAPLDAYRVILQVDERDIAEVTIKQRGMLVLSALPTDPLPFVIEKITPVSMAHEGRNYFRVEAQLEHTPTYLRPGMEGVGKITLGRRRILWNWTHRALDWLRLFVWSWLP